MLISSIAVTILGLLASLCHSAFFAVLAGYSFMFFFIALLSGESRAVLLGYTLGALALAGLLILSLRPMEAGNGVIGSADGPTGIYVTDELPVPSSPPVLIPDPPEMFNTIRVEGVRYYKPAAPDLFFVIKDIRL